MRCITLSKPFDDRAIRSVVTVAIAGKRLQRFDHLLQFDLLRSQLLDVSQGE